jgi:hypothetical protein
LASVGVWIFLTGSETIYLRKIVAVGWCYYRKWNDTGRNDEDSYEKCIQTFSKAHSFVMQNLEDISAERAAQAVEGLVGVLVEGQRFQEASIHYETLLLLNTRLEDFGMALRAKEQAMTCQIACLRNTGRFEEALKLASEGVLISAEGRHKLGHYFLFLEALVKADLVESPHYQQQRDASLKYIIDYMTGPITSLSHQQVIDEIFKESEASRNFLRKSFPQIP